MTVGGAPADKAARLVAPGEPVELTGPPPRYVSRGGEKLAAALDRFAVPVGGRDALDAGASTGGFTDCLLQHGSPQVWAVDVGHGQLHPRIREDQRVHVHERLNIRGVTLEILGRAGEPFPLIVADLSFISLRTVAAALAGLAGPGTEMVLLIKPQFEAGRREASKGRGVITDPVLWAGAVDQVGSALAALGAAMIDVMASPVLGAAGNVEFLAHLRVAPATAPGPSTATAGGPLIAAAVDEAIALVAGGLVPGSGRDA